ncbi:hypothetical protein HFK74_30595|uniref:hypothetical protein n=1 Tax=Pseudomonas sp. SbOxS1 TaxID=2723884 RepID=UPI0015D25519|nr:hypothetical protein [Pseudomonas sp. SbOxS1]NYU07058.1 hypothetical protein [Pseudomonas sp. SbOxS1]
MSDQEHIVDVCMGPVLPEPVKSVPDVVSVTTEGETPGEPEAKDATQRRSNFAAPSGGKGNGGKGSGLDSLGQGNLP